MYLLIMKKNDVFLFCKRFDSIVDINNFLDEHTWFKKYQKEIFLSIEVFN